MMGKLEKFRLLSQEERSILIRAWVSLLWMDLLLRLLPARRVFHRVSSGSPAARPVKLSAERIGELVGIAGRHHLWPMTCLRRSLVLKRILTRSGVPVTLRFGVRKEAGELAAHCWLEQDGRPIAEAADIDQRFLVLEGGGKAHGAI